MTNYVLAALQSLGEADRRRIAVAIHHYAENPDRDPVLGHVLDGVLMTWPTWKPNAPYASTSPA